MSHDPHVATRIGEARHPGPSVQPHCPRDSPRASGQRSLRIRVANATNLRTHWEMLTQADWDILLVQEHSLQGAALQHVSQVARQAGWHLHLGPLDPELGRTGGVGVLTRNGIRVVPLSVPKGSPLQGTLEDVRRTGRAELVHLAMPCGFVLTAAVLYGWTGGNTCADARQRTLHLADQVAAILAEVRAPFSPHCRRLEPVCQHAWAHWPASSGRLV